jgi:hypothetical protein
MMVFDEVSSPVEMSQWSEVPLAPTAVPFWSLGWTIAWWYNVEIDVVSSGDASKVLPRSISNR